MIKFTVRQARRYADLTELSLANAFKVSRPTYCKLEENPSLITTTQRQTLSDLTGIALSNIIFK